MTKCLLLFYINIFLLLKISHAQYNNRDWPKAPPTPTFQTPIPALAAPTNAPTFDRITPKCYPDTATAYFLPAPASSPKISVLNPNLKDVTDNKQNVQENLIKEVPSSVSFPPQSKMSGRVSFPPPPPPPPCLTGLPDIMDDIPSKIQDRISRLAQSEGNPPVCESCAALIKKLPIFNFDQELLNGFLAGIGI